MFLYLLASNPQQMEVQFNLIRYLVLLNRSIVSTDKIMTTILEIKKMA